MKITALTSQVKNPDRVNVFIDTRYSFSLTLTQILDEKIKVGLELDEQRLENLKKLSDEGKIYSRALEWLLRRPHSVKEFKEYMYRKKVDPELTQLLVDKFTKNGHLNDQNFANWWVTGRLAKNKSLRFITGELKQKGIDQNTILNVLDEHGALQDQNGQNSDQEALKILVQKLISRPRYADQNKLMRYLVGKGFSYSDVKAVLAGNNEQF